MCSIRSRISEITLGSAPYTYTWPSPAPGSYTQFQERATVQEDTTVPAAVEMIQQLVADHEAVAASGREVVRAAEAAGDDASVDLGVRRIDVHEKAAWMLRSHLE